MCNLLASAINHDVVIMDDMLQVGRYALAFLPLSTWLPRNYLHSPLITRLSFRQEKDKDA